MIRLIVPVLFILLAFTTGCKDKTSKTNENNDIEQVTPIGEEIDNNPKVSIILEDGRVINLELYREIAPLSVDNFLSLVDSKFYDGVIFHRIIRDFMVQTGGHYLDGNMINNKETTKTIKGEFASNGVENNLKHEFGVISMARATDPNSASGQFFICTGTHPHLDGQYAGFGKTIDEESNKVLSELNVIPTYPLHPSLADFPTTVITIKTITRI